MLDQEMVVLSDGLPGLLSLRLALDQRGEESTLDVARGGRTERIGLGDGKLLLGRAGDAALARATVVKVVLILQGLPRLLLAAQEFDLARVVHLPFTVPHPRSVLAVLLPDHLVDVVYFKPVRRNMNIGINHDLGSAGLLRLPLRHPLGVIEQLGQAFVVTNHVVPHDRVHSRVHRQLRLLQEVGPPAGLASVGQPALPGDMQLGLGRAGVEHGDAVHPQAVFLRFRVVAEGTFAEHVGSRQVSRDMDAVLMAEGNYLFQVLPVLVLVLKRPAAAPGNPDPVELRLLEQTKHFLEIAVIDVSQNVPFFVAELLAPPGPLGLPALDSSAVQPDETKISLFRPRRHLLRLGPIQSRRRLKRLGGAEQQGGGDQANQSNVAYDSDPLQGFSPSKRPRPPTVARSLAAAGGTWIMATGFAGASRR